MLGSSSIDMHPGFIPLQDLFVRERFAEIVALQLGAADFLEEADLLLCLHALADRVHAQSLGHFHQLGEDDFAALTRVQLPHKAHVEFDQVEADTLQYVQG